VRKRLSERHLVIAATYQYLKHLLPISITCKFHTFHVYRQIPLLAYSTYATFTAKFHCLQIPTSANNMTLPSKSNTCKFIQPIYCQNPLLADSITCKFTQSESAGKLRIFHRRYIVRISANKANITT